MRLQIKKIIEYKIEELSIKIHNIMIEVVYEKSYQLEEFVNDMNGINIEKLIKYIDDGIKCLQEPKVNELIIRYVYEDQSSTVMSYNEKTEEFELKEVRRNKANSMEQRSRALNFKAMTYVDKKEYVKFIESIQ